MNKVALTLTIYLMVAMKLNSLATFSGGISLQYSGLWLDCVWLYCGGSQGCHAPTGEVQVSTGTIFLYQSPTPDGRTCVMNLIHWITDLYSNLEGSIQDQRLFDAVNVVSTDSKCALNVVSNDGKCALTDINVVSTDSKCVNRSQCGQ